MEKTVNLPITEDNVDTHVNEIMATTRPTTIRIENFEVRSDLPKIQLALWNYIRSNLYGIITILHHDLGYDKLDAEKEYVTKTEVEWVGNHTVIHVTGTFSFTLDPQDLSSIFQTMYCNKEGTLFEYEIIDRRVIDAIVIKQKRIIDTLNQIDGDQYKRAVTTPPQEPVTTIRSKARYRTMNAILSNTMKAYQERQLELNGEIKFSVKVEGDYIVVTSSKKFGSDVVESKQLKLTLQKYGLINLTSLLALAELVKRINPYKNICNYYEHWYQCYITEIQNCLVTGEHKYLELFES